MAVREYLLDESAVEWVNKRGEGYSVRTLADGVAGGPQVQTSFAREVRKAEPHFHDVAQFQVSLEGTASYANRSIGAIGAYYSDPYTPYGHLVMAPNHYRAVIRPVRSGHSLEDGIVWMRDREGRKLRDPYARELYGQSSEVDWEELTGAEKGSRRKVLFGNDSDEQPQAQVLESGPDLALLRAPAPFGECDIIVSGSATWKGTEIKPYSMRYHVGDEAPAPLVAGPKGASWLILRFDKAAVPHEPTGVAVRLASA